MTNRQSVRVAALATALVLFVSPVFAQQAAPVKAAATEPVTVKNFARAESDMYFAKKVKEGGLGKFVHARTPTSVDQQDVIRMNRDTLYSSAIFDLDAGPVTIVLPEAGKRFMSLLVIDEDH
jgi:hypothetical protein